MVVTMAVRNPSSSLLFGLAAGIVAAATVGPAATRIRPTSSTGSWWSRLRPGGGDLLAAATTGVPIGLAYGVTKTPLHGAVAGLIEAFGFGLMVSVARPIADIDTPPTPGMRWRLDRQRALMVACSAAIPISVALGFQNDRTHGLLAGIVAAAGSGIMITLVMAVLGELKATVQRHLGAALETAGPRRTPGRRAGRRAGGAR
ncbi:hypothetical protein ABZ917_40545 [Nonomuraea wenchangensis]